MSTALKKTFRDIFIAILIGVIYLLYVRISGEGIHCFYLTFTGLPCPSCGITRMFVSLSRLQFAEAFKYNQFLFFTWPLYLAECIYVDYRIESRKDIPRWNLIMIIVFAVALLIFGTLRNLYHL